MKVYLATWLFERKHGDALTKINYPERLLSFFFLNEQKIKKKHLKEYVKTGRYDPRKNKTFTRTK